MVEMIAQRALDHASGFGRGQTLLGLPLELRLAQKDGEERAGAADDILGVELGGALVSHERAVGPEAAHQRGAHACLVATAQAGGDRVAVGGDKALLVLRPSERPLDPVGVAVERALAGEGSRCQRVALTEDGGQIVDQAARIVQDRFLRRRAGSCEQRCIAGPADLDATVEVGPRPRHLVERPRLKAQRFAKDLGIGAETHERAAPVGHGPGVLERAFRATTRVVLPPQPLVARHLDRQRLGERVDHREADAVQPSRCGVHLVAELPAGVQRGQDHFQRRDILVFRMRIDRDAPAVVPDRRRAVVVEHDLDPARVAGDRLVHRIVEQFGDEVMQRPLIGAADKHAGPAAHRLQPLQYLDVVRRVVAITGRRRLGRLPSPAAHAGCLARRLGLLGWGVLVEPFEEIEGIGHEVQLVR